MESVTRMALSSCKSEIISFSFGYMQIYITEVIVEFSFCGYCIVSISR